MATKPHDRSPRPAFRKHRIKSKLPKNVRPEWTTLMGPIPHIPHRTAGRSLNCPVICTVIPNTTEIW